MFTFLETIFGCGDTGNLNLSFLENHDLVVRHDAVAALKFRIVVCGVRIVRIVVVLVELRFKFLSVHLVGFLFLQETSAIFERPVSGKRWTC